MDLSENTLSDNIADVRDYVMSLDAKECKCGNSLLQVRNSLLLKYLSYLVKLAKVKIMGGEDNDVEDDSAQCPENTGK